MSTVLGLGSSVLLLPFVLRYLSEEHVGLWFVFNTIVSFSQIIEGGYQTTLVRNFGYVHGGARELAKDGLILPTHVSGIDVRLMSSLLCSARLVCTYMALAVVLALIVLGSVYICTIMPEGQSTRIPLIAWILFSFGYIISVKYGYISYLLLGQGNISEAQQSIAAPKAIQFILGAVALVFGMGLIGLGLAALIGNIFGRWIAWYYFRRHVPKELRYAKSDRSQSLKLIGVVSHNAYKIIIVALGTFLIQRSNILIASSLLGLSITVSYGLTTTVYGAINTISIAILQARLPQINALQISAQRSRLREIYGEISLVALAIFLVSTLSLIFFGEQVLGFISNRTHLIDTYPLCFFGLFYLFELNNGLVVTYLSSTNRIPYVKSIIVSGLAIVVLSITLCLTTSLGVWSLLLSQAIVQFAYNNWKWPYEAIKHLGGNYPEILCDGAWFIFRRATCK